MKIICACLNSKYIHSSLAPWCIKAGVDAFCHNNVSVKVMESTINGSITAFADEIIAQKPDIVALSCYIWNISKTLILAEYIRNNHTCLIVLGGPEVSFCGESLLDKYSFIDFISCGEGEWSFSSLINCLSEKKDLTDSEGLIFRDSKGNIIKTNLNSHNEMPPSPYCDEYFNALNGRIAYIEASRGCPYRCSYCLSGNVGKFRLFDIEAIKQSLILLASSSTKTVKFVDRTFNASYKHANLILEFIRENFADRRICFHFEIAADILHEETISILQNMPKGLVQLEIGIQSFNEKTLSHINRKTDLNKLCYNIKRLQLNKNLHIHTDLIAGLSYETLESFKESFNKAFALNSDMLQLGFLKLLNGSSMKEDKEKYPSEHSSEPPYEIISNPWLSPNELYEIKCCETALEKLYNSGRFILTINYLLNELNISPFDLFRNFSYVNNLTGISLTELTDKLYSHFSPFCSNEELKEVILCDLISIKSNIKLPQQLTSYDKNYKKFKKFFSEKFKCNVKIVILNSCSKIYVVPEKLSLNTRGRYEGLYYSINEIELKP